MVALYTRVHSALSLDAKINDFVEKLLTFATFGNSDWLAKTFFYKF